MKNKSQKCRIHIFFIIITLFVIFYRTNPHAPNFAPLTALTLLAGIKARSKYFALYPILAIAVTDILLGFYESIGYTWLAYVCIYTIAFLWQKKTFPNAIYISTISSFVFFVISNFGVYLEGLLYDRTLDGLIQCYVNAIPFYRNSFLSDLFFTTTFFILYHLFVKSEYVYLLTRKTVDNVD